MGENDESNAPRQENTNEEDIFSSFSSLADDVADRTENKRSTDQSQSLSDLAESIRAQRTGKSVADPDASDEQSKWDLLNHAENTSGEAEAGDSKAAAILELIGDAANVLIVGPADCVGEHSLCSRLMATPSAEPITLLLVTVQKTPKDQLTTLQNYITAPVSKVVVIDPQTYRRSQLADQYDGPVTIKTVPDPTDLRRIGILISKVLSEWKTEDIQPLICIHSLSDLIQLVENNELVFRFVHILQSAIESNGGRAHYHLDPTQHPEQTVRMFSSMFEMILQYDETGSLSVSQGEIE